MSINSFDDYPLTWRPVLPPSTLPLYRVLAQELEQAVRQRTLLPGRKLPPQRELADYLGMNVSTVTRAFRLCSDKGLLTAQVGRGTYVAYTVNTDLATAEKPPQQIEMASMMPETLQQDEASEILQLMLLEKGRGRFFQYSQERGAYDAAATVLLKRVGLSLGRNDAVLLAGGGQNAIAAVLASFFRRGDRIGVDPLVYSGFKDSARLFGIRLIPVGQENGEMSAAGIAYAVKNHHIKGLHITPDFQNPTTHILSKEGRTMLAEAANTYDLLIIEDAITSLLLAQPLLPVKALAPDRVIYVLSLSKTLLPSLRLAYVVCPAAQAAVLSEALHAINLSQSELLLELASRLILSGKYEELLRLRRERVARRNRLVNAVLGAYDIAGTAECISRWLTLPPAVTGLEFEKDAAAAGVSIYGAEHFAVGAAASVNGARLAIASPRDEAELTDGLRRLKILLDGYAYEGKK